MNHSVVGMHISYKAWNSTRGLYYFHRDLAISDAVHEGVENVLAPELEEELDNVYLEYYLEKRKE